MIWELRKVFEGECPTSYLTAFRYKKDAYNHSLRRVILSEFIEEMDVEHIQEIVSRNQE